MPNKVMTVNGEIGIESLGITLMHEHIFANNSGWWHCPSCKDRMYLANEKINMGILGELRMDPFVNKDNIVLDDKDAVRSELKELFQLGGRTVVDPTNIGIGRNPKVLREISNETNLNIVMGAGFYLQPTHPDYVKSFTKHDISELIEKEFLIGADDTGIKIGIIGEIGISKDFTQQEERVLRGAAMAAQKTKLPLSVHLPGWERHGIKVLDIAKEEGCLEKQIILCHMNPSFHDTDYQQKLAADGAWIEYDMVGMDYYYADQNAQCPYDNENAYAIKNLIDNGFLGSILLSQDVFIKMMLKKYGGFGYTYILTHFKKRLLDIGVLEDHINDILIDNPKKVFSFDII